MKLEQSWYTQHSPTVIMVKHTYTDRKKKKKKKEEESLLSPDSASTRPDQKQNASAVFQKAKHNTHVITDTNARVLACSAT